MVPVSFEFWILQTIAMLLTALLIPKFWFRGWLSAIILVFALGVVNSTIWDSALFLQIPNNLTTHSVTVLAANGAVFWLLAKILPGVEMRGWLPAVLAPVVFAVMSTLVYQYGRGTDWSGLAQTAAVYVAQIRDNLKTQNGPAQPPR